MEQGDVVELVVVRLGDHGAVRVELQSHHLVVVHFLAEGGVGHAPGVVVFVTNQTTCAIRIGIRFGESRMLLGSVTGQQSRRFPIPLTLNAGLRDFTLEASERGVEGAAESQPFSFHKESTIRVLLRTNLSTREPNSGSCMPKFDPVATP